MARNVGLVVLLMAAVAGSTLAAQAHERLRFQGRLTDSGGSAITTATDVVFNLYATPTGGTSVWTESFTGGSAIVPNANGVFTVELGATTSFAGVDFTQPLYLGITAGSDAEMTPRHLFTAATFAHHARGASRLQGGTWAEPGAIGATTPNTGAFTTVTATTFTGDLSGNVTGDLTGDASNALALLGGTWAVPGAIGATTPNTGAFTTVTATTFTGNLTGNVTGDLTGDASNALALLGGTWAVPGAIGATTPNTGAFTTVTATTFTGGLVGNVTGDLTGDASNALALLGGTWAVPGAIGATTPNTGAFTTVTATTFTGNLTGDVTGDLTGDASNALTLLGATWAAPAAIGSTTPNTGAFSTLGANGLTLGNTTTLGALTLHDGAGETGTFDVPTLTATRTWTLPDATGTLALTGSVLSLGGGTMAGPITFHGTQTFPGVLELGGGTMTGPITFAGGQAFPGVLALGGGTMTGDITFSGTQTFPGVLPLNGGIMTGTLQIGNAGNVGTLLVDDGSGSTSITLDGASGSVQATSFSGIGSGLTQLNANNLSAGNVAVGRGGTGATDAAGARANLGLAIGTNVQAFDALLASMAGLATSADQMVYLTGADTAATTSLTSFSRTLLDDADAATARGTLGLGTMATQSALNFLALSGGAMTGTLTTDGQLSLGAGVDIDLSGGMQIVNPNVAVNYITAIGNFLDFTAPIGAGSSKGQVLVVVNQAGNAASINLSTGTTTIASNRVAVFIWDSAVWRMVQ